jgi:hypothetical protein
MFDGDNIEKVQDLAPALVSKARLTLVGLEAVLMADIGHLPHVNTQGYDTSMDLLNTLATGRKPRLQQIKNRL